MSSAQFFRRLGGHVPRASPGRGPTRMMHSLAGRTVAAVPAGGSTPGRATAAWSLVALCLAGYATFRWGDDLAEQAHALWAGPVAAAAAAASPLLTAMHCDAGAPPETVRTAAPFTESRFSADMYFTAPAHHRENADILLPRVPAVPRHLPDGTLHVYGECTFRWIDEALAPGAAALPEGHLFFGTPALRDLSVHLSHGAAVNARGDVYQWGVDSPAPVLTLRGLDAVQVETAGQAPLSVALTRQGSIVVLSPIDAPPADHTATLTIANTGLASYLYPTKTITAEGVSHVLVCPEEPTIKFSKISVGDHHLLAVSTCGRLFSCPLTEKANAFGQLGLGTMGDVPTEDLFILRPVIGLPASHGVADVATGAGHSLAACDSGLVYAFGDNRMQQLTLGHIRMKSRSLTSFPEPTLCRGLPLLASDQWVSRTLAAGGKPDPEQPALPQQVVRLAAGGDTSAFVVIDRDPTPRYNVLVSGFGQFGQLGSGSFLHSVGRAHTVRNLSGLTSMDEATRTRQPIPIRTLSVSLGHCAAILDTTTPTGLPSRYIPPLDAFLWGDNRAGQLGNGLRAMVGVPWQPSERVLSPKKQDGSPAPRPEDLRDLPAVTGTPGHRFDLTCSPTATFVFLAADSR
ncbi:hypothetical protein H696_00002 [Fonticula alba]|uniref:Uncharacterized protein n=1 Tax=Fonticula alba TaxID=691883 RepID=A0A058ZG21_FONAL|nr:hypothetical protein H696_00002 [Fonticula alba]KCV72417.1 hypothetical protein H696_00002 [Fonticula alba]|eukprot:XP_009492118.1 hypothetical protein H696_00002 [Fonticula alba]